MQILLKLKVKKNKKEDFKNIEKKRKKKRE